MGFMSNSTVERIHQLGLTAEELRVVFAALNQYVQATRADMAQPDVSVTVREVIERKVHVASHILDVAYDQGVLDELGMRRVL